MGKTSDTYRLVAGLDNIVIDPRLDNFERQSAVLELNIVGGSDV